MSGTAWAPGSTTTVGSANTVVPERQTAVQGQTLITLLLFTYTPNTNSLLVMVNGVVQDSGTDYTETANNQITFTSGLTLGDRVTILGLTAIVGTSPALTFVRPSGSLFLNGISATPAAIGAGLIADYGGVANSGRLAAFDFAAVAYKNLSIDALVLNINVLSTGAVNFGGAVAVTGAFTPAQLAGIVGTTTNNSANAGSIGEFKTATVTQAAPTALTSNIPASLTSLALTAGDWDVSAIGGVTGAATTSLNYANIGISSVNNTLPAAEERWTVSYPAGGSVVFNNETMISGAIPPTRISLAAPATVFLVARANFGVSTCSGYGRISARRVR